MFFINFPMSAGPYSAANAVVLSLPKLLLKPREVEGLDSSISSAVLDFLRLRRLSRLLALLRLDALSRRVALLRFMTLVRLIPLKRLNPLELNLGVTRLVVLVRFVALLRCCCPGVSSGISGIDGGGEGGDVLGIV